MRNGYFSSKQQATLADLAETRRYESRDRSHDGHGLADTRPDGMVAHVYEGGDPDEIVVVTVVGDKGAPSFDDVIDLGPVGEHLHSFPASGGAYPRKPMILPRDRLEALLNARLTQAESGEAYDRAMSRATPATAPGMK